MTASRGRSRIKSPKQVRIPPSPLCSEMHPFHPLLLPPTMLSLVSPGQEKLESHSCPLQLGCMVAGLSWQSHSIGEGICSPTLPGPTQEQMTEATVIAALAELSLQAAQLERVGEALMILLPLGQQEKQPWQAGDKGKGRGGDMPLNMEGKGGYSPALETFFKVPRCSSSTVQPGRRVLLCHCTPSRSAPESISPVKMSNHL